MFFKSCILIVLFLFIAVPVSAQVPSKVQPPDYSVWSGRPLVSAAVSRDQVRFTALALTRQIRLEVLSQTGELVYDSGLRPGNRLEWGISDQQGMELRDGIYGCLVTVEDLNGQANRRQGIFRVGGGVVSFDATSREAAAAASDEPEALTILRAEDPTPFTLMSHNGTEGWVESVTGGLNFHAGSLSRSRDSVPHLRLTPEGNLGIGVAEPAARLDVAGLIRAAEGFQFSDGTILKMESGFPVLVTDSHQTGPAAALGTPVQGTSTGTGNRAGMRTIRFLAANGGIAITAASGGGPGRVLYNETGTNTYLGQNAGDALATEGNNSFFGYFSGHLTASTTGELAKYNSFMGAFSGYQNTTGYRNTFLGNAAGLNNSVGNYNTYIGEGVGYNATTASSNSILGQYAGFSNTGSSNSFFGRKAGYNNTANENSFFGIESGYSNSGGLQNSFFGAYAGRSNTIGHYNSFFGSDAGYSNTAGTENSFFGTAAGYWNTAPNNSFFGSFAGQNNTIGYSNSFFGANAGSANQSGKSNSFFGHQAGFSNIADGNTFVGAFAGLANTSGSGNGFFGYQAGMANDTGIYNSFFGHQAGLSNTSGAGNAFVGHSSGYANTLGTHNSFLGASAGYNNITGSENSFIGNTAGFTNTAGGNNSFVGYSAGYNNTAGGNSFFGSLAGHFNTMGSYNGFFGYEAGKTNTTGSFNNFIGYHAGFTNTTESYNSFIGANSDGAAGITNATALGYRSKVTQSNSLVLGSINGVNGATADTKVGIGITAPAVKLDVVGGMRVYPANENESGFVLSNQIAPSVWQFATYNSGKLYIQEAGVGPRIVVAPTTGNVGIGTTNPASLLHVNGTITALNFTTPSDERLKQDIKPLDYGLQEIMKLRAVSYYWKDPAKESKLNLGLIAQEVETVIPEVVTKRPDEAGTLTMNYPELIPVLIKAVQEQQSVIQEQRAALQAQKTEIQELKSTLEQVLERLTRDERPREK